MRTCADSYESTDHRDYVEMQMALAEGRRPAWMLETDRIGTALLNGTITEDEARTRLLVNGGTEREAGHQIAQWHRPVVSFPGVDERADCDA